MKNKTLLSLFLSAATLMCSSVQAEDIDLFTGAQPSSANLPNVLLVVDNTANWNQAFANEMAALAATFRNIPVNPDGSAKFNVGVMFSAETSSTDNNVNGGYVRAAIRSMTRDNAATYATMIAALDQTTDKGNGGSSSLVMAEAFRYFTQAAPIAGNFKAKADYLGNTGSDWSPSVTKPASLAAMKSVYALPGNALSGKGARVYNAPAGTGCTKNYIIYISNGASQDNQSGIDDANRYLREAGGSTSPIPLSPSGSVTNVSDEWARFMKEHAISVTTYTIDVDPKRSGQGPGWTKILQSMATVSDGKYTAVDSTVNGGAQISESVNKALSEIQAVNTVFASVSLPVSVNTQGTYLNQVYIGMFRPDADAAPRWNGNLKQYRLGLAGGKLGLEDADGASGINNLTGFISECARSFWTPTTADNYWTFKPQGTCIPPAGSASDLYKNSNFPDGSVVEKGGQAYLLRSNASRNMKTCQGACSSLSAFTKTNNSITATALGVPATDRDALIDWAYGLDVDDENNDSVFDTFRASAHGDVVHSRPVALNLGTESSAKVVVFYGGNDGVFRAINGNRTAAIGSTPAGGELWSFMPPEFYPALKRLRSNSPQIKFPNITASDARSKNYGLDGTVTAYQGEGQTWVYGTMRRGGRGMYAFNVNAADPTQIGIKWKKGCPSSFASNGSVDDTGCSPGFSGLGQTWSAPKVIKSSGYGSGAKPMLIFGGGHDVCEDSDPHTCSSSSKGRSVYVLDADTGAILATFPTDRPVIADITVAPDTITGLTQYAYVADTGGNVYRITFLDLEAGDWSMTKIASLGCATPSSCSGNRKFMFAPDITFAGGIYSLLLGSGDREKPMLYNNGSSVTNSVSNYFFRLDDKPGDPEWLSSETSRCGSAVMCLASLKGITTAANPTAAEMIGKKGWYLGLRSTEQVVTSAITIFGTVTFSTHQPNPPNALTCSNDLGMTRVYNVQFADAAPLKPTLQRFEDMPAVGLPPSPVAGLVTLDNGKTVAFCIGCSAESPLEAKEPPIPTVATPKIPKSRTYWYVED